MKETELPLTAREVLTQLTTIRRSGEPKHKDAVGVKKVAEALEPHAKTLLAAAGGAEHARAETARAVLALNEAYQDKENLVHDRLWAAAVNAAYRWRDAEGE